MHVLVDERVLGDRVGVADRFWPRLNGLMFRPALSAGEGLLLRPCNSVHTWFMRFPIDVLYLDTAGRVLRVDAHMPPWRFGPLVRGAKQVLELPAGSVESAGISLGDQLTLVTSVQVV